MGTNYYLHLKPPCHACGREVEEPLHIGKSSYGWAFALHVVPEQLIFDLPDWERLWALPGAVIRDEYGADIAPEEMKRVITERTHPDGLRRHEGYSATVGSGTWDLCPYVFR